MTLFNFLFVSTCILMRVGQDLISAQVRAPTLGVGVAIVPPLKGDQMPSPNDMIGAIASRSYDDSEGSRMRAFKEETENARGSEDIKRLNESDEGRRFVDRVRGAEATSPSSW